MPKSLMQMRAEVAAYQKEKGWDHPRSFAVSMTLLHEEVAEAGRAWREWGLEDHTSGVSAATPDGHWRAKPEGVGSEFADIFIRLLDTDARHDLHLVEHLESAQAVFDGDREFMENIYILHNLLAHVTWTLEVGGATPYEEFAAVLAFLRLLARHSGIDLAFEYERKMRYNRTRDFRHGGRRV